MKGKFKDKHSTKSYNKKNKHQYLYKCQIVYQILLLNNVLINLKNNQIKFHFKALIKFR
jgi:hypothetical protein